MTSFLIAAGFTTLKILLNVFIAASHSTNITLPTSFTKAKTIKQIFRILETNKSKMTKKYFIPNKITTWK